MQRCGRKATTTRLHCRAAQTSASTMSSRPEGTEGARNREVGREGREGGWAASGTRAACILLVIRMYLYPWAWVCWLLF